jgi:hypothetical protein
MAGHGEIETETKTKIVIEEIVSATRSLLCVVNVGRITLFKTLFFPTRSNVDFMFTN